MKNDQAHTVQRPRVVIVGGGFAGQAVARGLRRAPVDILLIDKNNYQTFQPLLYQVATAALKPEEIAYPIRSVFKRQRNTRFRLGSVMGVDWNRRRVLLAGQKPVPFDYLVLAAGSTPAYFNIPGADVHGFPLKHLNDAIELRTHIIQLFEEADRRPELIRRGLLNIVIVGGGPTGVEMAGAMHELLHNTLRRDFPHLPFEKARIVLVEAGASLLQPFTEESRRHALETLTERGIHVACGEQVVRITDRAVYLSSRRVIPTTTPIWTVGVRASPLADLLALEQTRGGRIKVEDDLSVPARPNVFVAGDMAGSSGLHPQLASVARQAGKHVARQIVRRIEGEAATPFVYRSPGKMATISRQLAVAEFPGDIRLEGVFAWLAWLVLHLVLLTGLRNRLHVLISWLVNYFTNDRSSRLILELSKEKPASAAKPVWAGRPANGTSPRKQPAPRPSSAPSSTQESLQRLQKLLEYVETSERAGKRPRLEPASPSRAA